MVTRRDLPDLPQRTGAHRFQILALSGGGYRGLFSARVLELLEQKNRRPIYESFDLVAGTSIGGIIAIALACEIDAATIRQKIEERGTQIFPGRDGWRGWPGRVARTIRSAFVPKYRNTGLRAAIEDIVGPDRRLRDLRRPLLVPSVAVTAGASHLFRTPHHPATRTDPNRALVDIALATSAAPVYFPLSKMDRDGAGDPAEYVDGGLIANAPDLAALIEAESHFRAPSSEIFMMSVGTTSADAAFAARGHLRRGALGWMRKQRLLEVTMAAQQAHATSLCEQSLGARYFRINRAQSADQADVLALDRATASATDTLRGMAADAAAEALQDERATLFLSHRGQSLLADAT